MYGYQCGQSKWNGSAKLGEPSAGAGLEASSAEEKGGLWALAGSNEQGSPMMGAMGQVKAGWGDDWHGRKGTVKVWQLACLYAGGKAEVDCGRTCEASLWA